MRKYPKYYLVLFTVLILISCSKESDSSQSYSPSVTSGNQTSSNTLPSSLLQSVTEPYEEGNYIWRNLNFWYYWQEFVTDLSDNKASSNTSYASFIN